MGIEWATPSSLQHQERIEGAGPLRSNNNVTSKNNNKEPFTVTT